MIRVPGSTSSLADEKAAGADVRVVYSPLDAVELAAANPRSARSSSWVWALRPPRPPSRRCILEAAARELANFSVFACTRTTPAALLAIASDPETAIDGFILPGHVSTITGLAPYRFFGERVLHPGVVTGFEPVDVLEGIARLVELVVAGAPPSRTPTGAASPTRATRSRGVWSSRYSNPATPHGAASGACLAPASPSATPSPA